MACGNPNVTSSSGSTGVRFRIGTSVHRLLQKSSVNKMIFMLRILVKILFCGMINLQVSFNCYDSPSVIIGLYRCTWIEKNVIYVLSETLRIRIKSCDA